MNDCLEELNDNLSEPPSIGQQFPVSEQSRPLEWYLNDIWTKVGCNRLEIEVKILAEDLQESHFKSGKEDIVYIQAAFQKIW